MAFVVTALAAADVVASLVAGRLSQGISVASAPGAGQPRPHKRLPKNEAAYVTPIVKRNLFRIASLEAPAEKKPSAEETTGPLQTSSLAQRFELVGTVVATNRAESVAVVQERAGAQDSKIYLVGEKLGDEADIVAVEATRIVLRAQRTQRADRDRARGRPAGRDRAVSPGGRLGGLPASAARRRRRGNPPQPGRQLHARLAHGRGAARQPLGAPHPGPRRPQLRGRQDQRLPALQHQARLDLRSDRAPQRRRDPQGQLERAQRSRGGAERVPGAAQLARLPGHRAAQQPRGDALLPGALTLGRRRGVGDPHRSGARARASTHSNEVGMRTWIRPFAAAGGLLVVLLVGPGMAFAQEPAAAEPAAAENPACSKPDPSKKYTFNFHKIEVEKLAAIINQITCKRIIFEEKVRQKLTIFSQDAVTAEEAFELFQAALDAGGQYTLIPFRGGYKIVLTRDSKGLGIPTSSGRGDPSSESMIVTQMVRLKYVDAAELAQVFQQLISRDASIVPYPPTNTLIITDTGSNIRRLLDMVAAVDVQESEQRIEVLTLQYAAAADIAEKVAQILAAPDDAQSGGNRTIRTTPGTPRPPTPGGVPGGSPAEFEISPGKQAKILPYERTNSIIVVAGQAEIEKVRELVRQLDFDAPPGRAHFNVVHLRYARADEIVEVLAQLLGGGGGGGSGGSRSSRSRSLSGSSGFGSSSNRFGSSSLGGSNVAGIGSTLGSGTSSLNRTEGGTGVSRAAAEAGEQFTGQVSVTADPATNSLLVSASPEDFRVLRPVIDELDVRRKQVFVEAAILEVALNDSQTMGVQMSSIAGGSNALGLIRSSLDPTSPIGGVLADPVNNFPLGFGAAITSTYTVQLRDAEGNVVEVPAAAVLIQALAANSNVNVLSTPHILTTDNEEAQIVVGQQVPFPTGTVFSNGGVNPVQTVERQDVGLTLRITPQISDAGYIRLDIFQEVSAVVPSTDTEVLTSLGPTTTKRSAETRVVVKDDQTVVIGGLIQDRLTTVETKIPYLGDIPYLGWLFSTNTDRNEKVNLMILLTPRVVREDEDVNKISNNKRQDTDDFYQGSQQVNPLENYIDRLHEQYPPQRPAEVPEPKALIYTPPRTIDGRDNQGIEGSTYSSPGAAPGAPIPTGRTSVGPGAATAPSGRTLPVPAAPVIPPASPPPAASTPPPAARLDVTPEPDLSRAAPPPAARPAFDTRGAEAPVPAPSFTTPAPEARSERAGTIRAALGPVPPPGFESSPLELTLQTAAAKNQRIVGLLVFVDGDLVFSRHADTGVLESPAPITLFVNGLPAGDHEVKISLDVSDPRKKSQEVTASFSVVIPSDARKVVRAKVLEGKGREPSAPTILWTESEEAA
ncbi:MAG: type II secretion system secretin GspD [Deltaproteobacteria bacterium]|nr:type II secretion system secretin GspD [Deltaproteobacteria bacterium]